MKVPHLLAGNSCTLLSTSFTSPSNSSLKGTECSRLFPALKYTQLFYWQNFYLHFSRHQFILQQLAVTVAPMALNSKRKPRNGVSRHSNPLTIVSFIIVQADYCQPDSIHLNPGRLRKKGTGILRWVLRTGATFRTHKLFLLCRSLIYKSS